MGIDVYGGDRPGMYQVHTPSRVERTHYTWLILASRTELRCAAKQCVARKEAQCDVLCCAVCGPEVLCGSFTGLFSVGN
eukprot:2333400-Rhodomonas_salina.1